MIDYQIVYIDIPVKEMVTENEDGSYTIFVNKNISEEKQKKAIRHALSHIRRATSGRVMYKK